MTMCSRGHRYTGTQCRHPDCYRGTASRPELNKRQWQNMRRHIKNRDGNQCRCCGTTLNLTVHHIERGGPSQPNNLITLCSRCHSWAERGQLRITNDVITLDDLRAM